MPDHVDIAELRRLEKAATPGPWWVTKEDRGHGLVTYGVRDSWGNWIAEHFGPDEDQCTVVHFIAAMRNALPALLDEVEQARERDARIRILAYGNVEMSKETK